MTALQPLFQGLTVLAPYIEQGCTILTPNRRLARAALATFEADQLAAGARAWKTPPIVPLSQWLETQWHSAVMAGRLPPREILDVPRERRLWREIIDEGGEGFTLVSSAAAARRCQDARRNLSLWQVDIGQPSTAQQFSFSPDSQCYLRWLAQFSQRLIEHGAITPEGAVAELLSVAEDRLSGQRLVLLDCAALPPLHRAVIDSAGSVIELSSGQPGARSSPVTAFPDERSELKAIARWCRERFESAPQLRTGVVLQDMGATRETLELFLRQEFDCLTGRYESLPVNFATGLTLDRVPLARDGLRILAMAGKSVQLATFRALLHSRFIATPPLATECLAEALENLDALGAEEIPQRVLLAVLEGLGSDTGDELPWRRSMALQNQGRWHQRRRPPSSWIEPFRAQLEAWDWLRGPALDSLEHQQAEQWFSTLETMAKYDRICPVLSLAEAVALLREICAETLFQPHTNDTAIQVLGPRETTGLSFDALWLSGMTARLWPGAPRPNPYLPFSLQRERRMPNVDSAWNREQAMERWESWQRSCEELHSSYVAIEDEAPAPPSPLLAASAVTSGGESQPDPRWLAQAAEIGQQRVSLAPVPLGDAEAAGSSAGVAVLQEIAACHFQAFARRRLEVQAPARASPWLDPAERGSVLHDALFRIFGEIPGSAALRERSATEIETRVTDAVEQALRRLPPLRRELLGPLPVQLERERLCALLGQWLEFERQREQDFQVIAREQSYELQLGGLTLRLRTDREDRLDGGQRVLLDYKSGRPESPSQWFSTPPRRPQLPVYALLDPAPDAISYASVRPGACALHGVGSNVELPGVRTDFTRESRREDIADMDSARAFWQRELTQLADEFVAGLATVEPRHSNACDYCQRFSLCRLAEEAS